MSATGELRTVGLSKNETILCRARISYPIVKVNKTEFDFGTCFLGDVFKVKIENKFTLLRRILARHLHGQLVKLRNSIPIHPTRKEQLLRVTDLWYS